MFPAILLAMQTTAHASLTIQWNTRNTAASATAPAPQRTAYGTLLSVTGDRVIVRLPDGSERHYIALPSQVQMLRPLVGSRIQFTIR